MLDQFNFAQLLQVCRSLSRLASFCFVELSRAKTIHIRCGSFNAAFKKRESKCSSILAATESDIHRQTRSPLA